MINDFFSKTELVNVGMTGCIINIMRHSQELEGVAKKKKIKGKKKKGNSERK